MNKEYIQSVFIRIAKDSQFQMDTFKLIHFVANLLKIHPIEVWAAFPYLDTMHEIASGKHPILKIEKGT